MTNLEKHFPGYAIDDFKGVTGLATNNKNPTCDKCPAEELCAKDKEGRTCWGASRMG